MYLIGPVAGRGGFITFWFLTLFGGELTAQLHFLFHLPPRAFPPLTSGRALLAICFFLATFVFLFNLSFRSTPTTPRGHFHPPLTHGFGLKVSILKCSPPSCARTFTFAITVSVVFLPELRIQGQLFGMCSVPLSSRSFVTRDLLSVLPLRSLRGA